MSVRPATIPFLPLVLLPQLGTLTIERQVGETRKDHAVEILESLEYHLSASFTKRQAACTRYLTRLKYLQTATAAIEDIVSLRNTLRNPEPYQCPRIFLADSHAIFGLDHILQARLLVRVLCDMGYSVTPQERCPIVDTAHLLFIN